MTASQPGTSRFSTTRHPWCPPAALPIFTSRIAWPENCAAFIFEAFTRATRKPSSTRSMLRASSSSSPTPKNPPNDTSPPSTISNPTCYYTSPMTNYRKATFTSRAVPSAAPSSTQNTRSATRSCAATNATNAVCSPTSSSPARMFSCGPLAPPRAGAATSSWRLLRCTPSGNARGRRCRRCLRGRSGARGFRGRGGIGGG
mmetsp:Transcript_6908/g.16886  ORF Transcript_6908/g.16886 Transcript_6908/m.16886 type:complete len:201 (-) Transcript_6908:380-982(-)